MRVPTSCFVHDALRERLSDPAARPARIYRDGAPQPPARMNAAAALLERGLAQAGEGATAAIHGPDIVTPAALARRSAACAHVLKNHCGVEPGMPVVFRAANSPALMAAMLGALRVGAILTPTVPLFSASELSDVLTRIAPALIVADDADDPALGAACDAACVQPRVLALRDGAGSLERQAAEVAGVPFSDVMADRDDPALVLFTSGTTGRAKAVAHSHGDILSVADSFGRHIFCAGPGDVVTGTPSLAFAYGFGLMLVTPLAAGASIAFPSGRGMDALRKTLAEGGATMLVTAPTAYRKLMEGATGLELLALRRCFSAGEPLAEATRADWRRKTGLEIVDLLGSTEMLGPYVSAPENDQRPGVVGRAVPGYELEILDKDGAACAAGEAGRLAVRGPTGGVYLDSEPTGSGLADGWTVTGDICVMDAEGYVRCLGRADDIIVSSGYNISAIEVETALAGHPDVAECAATGLPDPRYGQALALAVVPTATATEDTQALLRAFLESRLAAFKLPRRIAFVDALPRTASGKIRRAEVADLFRQDVE